MAAARFRLRALPRMARACVRNPQISWGVISLERQSMQVEVAVTESNDQRGAGDSTLYAPNSDRVFEKTIVFIVTMLSIKHQTTSKLEQSGEQSSWRLNHVLRMGLCGAASICYSGASSRIA